MGASYCSAADLAAGYARQELDPVSVNVPTTDDEAGPLSATIPLTALSIFAGLCSG